MNKSFIIASFLLILSCQPNTNPNNASTIENLKEEIKKLSDQKNKEVVLPTPKPSVSIAPQPIESPKTVDPVKDLEKIVDNLNLHFTPNAYYVNKWDASSEQPDRYQVHKYTLNKISYDVQKTDSLVSPFTGEIKLSYFRTKNTKCGDYGSNENKDFTSAEKALTKKNDNSCYFVGDVPGSSGDEDATMHFAFQKEKWILKSISNSNGYFLYLPLAYNVPSTNKSTSGGKISEQENKEAYQINKKWIDSIQY